LRKVVPRVGGRAIYPEIEGPVMAAVRAAARHGLQLTDAQIRSVASAEYAKLFPSEALRPWYPSNGWLYQLKKKHGLVEHRVRGPTDCFDTGALPRRDVGGGVRTE
jgi:hypothetical protein